jgi:CheY-like chemotaxis protein
MSAMRTWLDDRGFAPSRFRCNDLETGDIALRVDFERADQAGAFAAAFSPEKKATETLVAADAVHRPITPDQDNASVDQTRRVVLVVDDEPDIRQLVTDVLSYEGFKIIEAGSGTEALYRIRSDIPIDLLFTDIMMPGGLDGFALARRARELRSSLPVIYTSAYLKDLPPEEAASRFGTMLRKPFPNHRLIAEVRRVLG